jgi:hypothetical protein
MTEDEAKRSFSIRVERRPAVIRHMINEEASVVICADPLTRKAATGTRTSIGFPVLLVTGWVDEPEVFGRKVAALLQEHQS